ncbi:MULTISPECIES: DUF4197 domain-containing protein [unclassified Spirosoma]|uniref:DUF4197 domain-containing protein n=1 Tax=unclassified Spirosoma TaxID=2621999 RepID=UPI00095F969C|nr:MULTISPECIES: DUF4197 domain-containing protein [unclassified Spirosoma]MBN8821108.1 DUF4197 domain-containing protein [Spirosoma sp.]OJW79255.1 MAG: hypothetical protein BGO59_11985 [Spirosoma sp. 48-14]
MMNKTIFTAALLAFALSQPSFAQDSTRQQQSSGGGIFGKILKAVTETAPTTSGGLTSTDIASGLKEALRIGVTNGSNQASKLDGYFKNPLLKIAFPPEAQNVATRLRQLGFNKQVDQFELSMNRAAEDAAKKAAPVFVKAITSMSIQDAVGILRGNDDAATQYLRRTSGQQLVTEFTPIVDSTLRKNNATKYYTDLANIYNKIPLVQKVNPNLTEYATGKAVDGLFILVAQEEKKIRENPAARVTDLLKKVFSKQ